VARTIRRLGRAVIIGAATVFATKRPHEHWSTPPTAVAQAEQGTDASGQGGPEDDDPMPPFLLNGP
jgi:hypothetical protein